MKFSFSVVTHRLCTLRAGFTNRLCRLKPRASVEHRRTRRGSGGGRPHPRVWKISG